MDDVAALLAGLDDSEEAETVTYDNVAQLIEDIEFEMDVTPAPARRAPALSPNEASEVAPTTAKPLSDVLTRFPRPGMRQEATPSLDGAVAQRPTRVAWAVAATACAVAMVVLGVALQ